MTLFECHAAGVFPSGQRWSFRINHSSAATVATVEADWLTQITSFWTNGTHGVETLFPVGTVLETTTTYQLAVVSFAGPPPVDKIRRVAVRLDNPALAGTSANAAGADQDAILVSLRTALPGRENRGRIHLPSPDETLVTNSELGSTPSTRVTTAATALLSGMAAAGHQPGRVTYVKTKGGTPVGSFQPYVTPAETDRVIRSQRVRVKRRKAIYV